MAVQSLSRGTLLINGRLIAAPDSTAITPPQSFGTVYNGVPVVAAGLPTLPTAGGAVLPGTPVSAGVGGGPAGGHNAAAAAAQPFNWKLSPLPLWSVALVLGYAILHYQILGAHL